MRKISSLDIFGEGKIGWIERAKTTLKKGGIKIVLEELKGLEEQHPNHKGLIACIRYIENRENQFAYDKAIEQELPIGSGKIESAHRNIIQQRIKKPGAWWKPELAEAMINLRILRANGDWDEFWQEEGHQGMAA